MNPSICDNVVDVEKLKINLREQLEKTFQVQFGIAATWLNCGAPVTDPLRNVIFFKKPTCGSKTIQLDNTSYHSLYPLQK